MCDKPRTARAARGGGGADTAGRRPSGGDYKCAVVSWRGVRALS